MPKYADTALLLEVPVLIDIRKDLIEKELQSGCSEGMRFKPFKMTQRFIDWVFTKYFTHEYAIKFYDSEPDIPEEWDSEDASIWDNPEFIKVWDALVEAHEPSRIKFNNWVDPFGEGIWDWSQEEVDEFSREHMENLTTQEVDQSERLYIGFNKDGCAFIYWYGRDYNKADYWWIMQPRSTVA